MEYNYLWINATSIPYKAFLFFEPTEELILEGRDEESIREYFNRLQRLTQRGYYALGFIAYEMGYLLERKLYPLFIPPKVPLAHFILFKRLEKRNVFPSKVFPKIKIYEASLSISEEEYKRAINQIKEYIARGDTYQVNYTTKFYFLFQGIPWELFFSLLFSQRCSYACFFNTSNYYLLSLSPELFLKRRGPVITSSPMKGTIKRGYSLKEDMAQKEFLRGDVKSMAENVMIVDLIRNDLGKICESGSIWAKELFKIKSYPTLHQMISTLCGALEKETLFEVFKALFPCGSVTGAPKIRTMEIIRELEKEPRNVYTGAIGFVTPKGDFLFNVAIRSALLFPKEKNLYQGELGVGAGIVWDSTPVKEYEETKLKGKFFFSPFPYFCLFETFKWEKGKGNILLHLHYKRLKTSASYFKFKLPFELKNFNSFKKFVEAKLKDYEKELLRVKLILTPEGEIKVEAIPFHHQFSPEQSLRIGLIKRKTPINVFHFHKTTFREEYDAARHLACDKGLDEIIFYNEKGELLEGTITNVFWKKGHLFYTPPLSLGILPGILRESLLREKKALEKVITLEDLFKGEGCFYVGNSLRGLGKVESYIIIE